MTDEKVLIADDDSGILFVLKEFFADKNIKVITAKDGKEATVAFIKDKPTIAVMDINMPGKNGLAILEDIKANGNPCMVIIMTADSSMKNTLEAMKHGAFDYISKPFDLDELEIIVDKALEASRLKQTVKNLTKRLKERTTELTFAGNSKEIQAVFKDVGKVSGQDVTALILGESGTGKELLAKIIYLSSPRSEGPFIAINSAAVSRDLMESELFGFEKGAFTGATESRPGKFELADGGTLFLDEVGDMSLEVQSKLLRAIQEQEFYRVGGKSPIKVNVRIITATNKNLSDAVKEGTFREDLLYRLNVVTFTLPPLRERTGDIEVLSDFFLDKFCVDMGVGHKTLSPEAIKELCEYNWPGNVRELENVLRRAVLMGHTNIITPNDLDLPDSKEKSLSIEDIITAKLEPFIDRVAKKGTLDLYNTIIPYMERPLITLVLKKTKYNQVKASELLGINRNTLRKKIKELKIPIKP